MRTLRAFTLTFLTLFGGAALADNDTDEALRIYYGGDRHKAVGLLTNILKKNPSNAEAQYMVAYAMYSRNEGTYQEYSQYLQQVVGLANANGEVALGHYILAQLASEGGDYDLALSEIANALTLDPTSVRYLRAKMTYYFEKASATKSAKFAEMGLATFEQALSQVPNDPKQYFTSGSMHFEVGRWMPTSNDEYLKLSISHFQSAIAAGGISETSRAFSWGNMSGHYYRLGRCPEAKDAAESALAIRKYGSARRNLRLAEQCIQRSEPQGWLCRYLNFCG